MSSEAFNGEILGEKLSKLNNSQQSIESLSRWCVTHRKRAKQIVETWEKVFNSSQKEQCVSFLYLANDILQNSRRKGSEFVNEFWKVLPSALKQVCEKGDDSGKKVVSRLVDIWEERKVFGSRGQGLKDVMMGKDLPPPPPVSNGKNQNLIKIMKKDAQAVRVKLIVGSMPEKVVMAFHAANDEKNDEEATLKKCRDVLDNAAHGAEPPVEEIRNCIKELESVEETRSALVSQLREALQDQKEKLDVIRNHLQIARRQIELPDVMKMSDSSFPVAQTSGASFQLSASQPMTSFMPIQSTEEEKKKAAAAAMAAKLAASTSSAQMLTSVLSSLVAEEAASMNGGGQSHPPGFGLKIPMFPPEKRAKLEKAPASEISSSDTVTNSYFASLQQSMANMPMPQQPNQGQTQFPQPPNNHHFAQSSAVMMPYGYNTNSTLPPPPPPLPPSVAMGLTRPPSTQHPQQQQQSQQSPVSGGYYRPPGIGFYGQSHPPATPSMPRQ
uniref:CID domain-containing protein n=1 Tax=Kalanchoe fedtschenkoi TaxID=63787 RepID=A0A7N0UZT2_KALFE